MTKTSRVSKTLGVCVVLLLALAGCGEPYHFHGTLLDPPLPTADFALTNQHAEPAQLSDYRGQWVLLFFGDSNCPDACPLTLSDLKQVRQSLSEFDAARVRFVMVTVDPARDTPAQLKSYLAQVDTSFAGLTGSPQVLMLMERSFGVSVAETPTSPSAGTAALAAPPASTAATNSVIQHTSSVFLLNPSGQIRMLYTQIPWQDVSADVRELLAASRRQTEVGN